MTVKHILFAGVAVLIVCQTITNCAVAVQYKATLLHPQGAKESYAFGVSGTQQIGWGRWPPYTDHAILWNGSANTFVDLHPIGFGYSVAFDVHGDRQVGVGTSPVTEYLDEHAMLWNGTADSVVDLHPEGFEYSVAVAISGSSQVGCAGPLSFSCNTDADNGMHAILWSGTAESAVDLHPPTFRGSAALGVSGSRQVGYGETADRKSYALMWNGTAESVINLNPTGFIASRANDIAGDYQIGYATSAPFNTHALLWNGSADNFVDLHPSGFLYSHGVGISTSGELQVGNGATSALPTETHALLWRRTAESAVDLHQYLTPLGIPFTYSEAHAVDDNGTVVGIGYTDNPDFVGYAILWTPIPEPSSCTLFAIGLAAALVARRNRR